MWHEKLRHLHSQEFPNVFIDDVADADGRDNFHEIRGNPSVKTTRSLISPYPPEYRHHIVLGAVRGWK